MVPGQSWVCVGQSQCMPVVFVKSLKMHLHSRKVFPFEGWLKRKTELKQSLGQCGKVKSKRHGSFSQARAFHNFESQESESWVRNPSVVEEPSCWTRFRFHPQVPWSRWSTQQSWSRVTQDAPQLDTLHGVGRLEQRRAEYLGNRARAVRQLNRSEDAVNN